MRCSPAYSHAAWLLGRPLCPLPPPREVVAAPASASAAAAAAAVAAAAVAAEAAAVAVGLARVGELEGAAASVQEAVGGLEVRCARVCLGVWGVWERI